MKKKNKTKICTKMITACLTLAMFFGAVVVMPKEAKAAEEPTTIYYDNGATKKYKISDYWENRKVPVKPGYVFGGWYVEQNGKHTPLQEEVLRNATISDYNSTAYAKFVPANVLSIKTQGALGDSTSSLRILSSVDGTNYQEVGFEYKLGILAEGKTEKITKVYKAIKPHKNAKEAEYIYPGTTFVEGVSEYFIAADVSDIKSTSYAKIIYARPYWITMDGTTVMGLARNNRIVDKQNQNQYTSVGINLLTDGKAVAQVAAGKIQVTYNTDDYDVVDAKADTTYDSTNGGKYMFPEMEYHVDEAAGTITFVGNAENVDEHLTADGLFANVRFVKTTTEETALNFAVKTDMTEFCNWEEDTVTEFVVQ